MKDENEKIKKQSCINNVFSYCIYFFDVPLIDLLIDEITQLGIITVYCKNSKKQKMKDEYEKIKKQSCISNVFSYCIDFFEVPLIDLLIDEITQLRIITV